MHFVFDVIIILLGFIGLFVALHIHNKKSKKVPLICPLRSNCDTVIHSDYSKFLGIRVERLGIIYYSLIVIGHGMFLFFPGTLDPFFITVSSVLSACAFVFSIYLLSIQAFILKQWCFWCLVSASLSISIFLLAFFS